MEAFEVIAIFNFTHEIIVIKHRLEQEGIPYFFENEATLGIVPFYNTALGGIKLKVHPNDFENVRLILEELKGGNLTIV
ncbi:MAG: DUF2007 domain-containing protein [Flavobacterium sp.]|nr:DUF2007 domain-containing protein [Flavobacterium sp.]